MLSLGAFSVRLNSERKNSQTCTPCCRMHRFIMHSSLEKSLTKMTLTLTARCAAGIWATMEIDCGLQLLAAINKAYQRIPQTYFLCRNLHGFIILVYNFKAFLSFLYKKNEIDSYQGQLSGIGLGLLVNHIHPKETVYTVSKNFLKEDVTCQNLFSSICDAFLWRHYLYMALPTALCALLQMSFYAASVGLYNMQSFTNWWWVLLSG